MDKSEKKIKERNIKKAIKYLEVAEQNKNALAAFNLGLLYEKGRTGFPKNIQNAVEYYEKASSYGDFRSRARLGFIYIKGKDGFPIDIEKGIKNTKEAAEVEDSMACFNLGMYYIRGLYGLKKDIPKALELFGKANSVAGWMKIGSIYKNGDENFPTNLDLAKEAYHKALVLANENDDPQSQIILSLLSTL